MQTQKIPSFEIREIGPLSPEKDSNIMLSPTNTSFLGDYIGMESCLDLKNNNEDIVCATNDDVYDHIRDKRDQRWAMKKIEFPPPITLLARTENLHSHMPWVLKRQYTGDGRLILTEERVRHHEYLRAHRSNGRLTLQLVPLDDDVPVPHISDEEEDIEDEVVDDGDSVNDFDDDNDIKVQEGITDKEEEGIEGSSTLKIETPMHEPSSSSMENGKSGINGGPNKCLNYSSVRISSSCYLFMPVPSIRPVHT
ncbi:DUF3049 domain-containing protein [Cephalotus follicularis]|uniref:DUF3049 domain-containing protein n=1 Tax=Cephalotus follicularis TaxID=3775 RepID=A0A1Q3AU84_CEPFO|nr:DUF3049 domain-containing protein [Cephalotus follicularis]